VLSTIEGVSRRRNPARLVIALSVAAALAVFLVYTSLAGGTPSLRPSTLPGHQGRVSVVGRVIGKPTGDAHSAAGKRFQLRDVDGTASVPVVYRGSVPDLFRSGRDVVVEGRLQNGVLVADTLTTKCPSKYSPKRDT
jgi:cytochrome c-type biogenesis protein CcmE